MSDYMAGCAKQDGYSGVRSQPGPTPKQPPWRPGPRPTPTNPNPVDFGPNVLIFDPSMTDIQSRTDGIYQQQDGDPNEFGPGRYAYFFKPGVYNNLNVHIAYYTTVHGLGNLPGDVTINGTVQSVGGAAGGLALNSFWRGAENLAVTPPPILVGGKNRNINFWAVSQATFLRRFHVKGELVLFDALSAINASSGGFVADCVIDTAVTPGSQQQFLTRNTTLTSWIGGTGAFPWNMVFVGDDQPPSGSWPAEPYTVVGKTPVIREKPYLVIDSNGNYAVQLPALKKDSHGTSWAGKPDIVTTLPMNKFYIAKTSIDTADSLNAALQQGYHLIMTPGIYYLASTVEVNYPDTVILGLGMATLMPVTGKPAMIIADVDGVSVSGIIFDAGPIQSPSLLIVGSSTSNVDHSAKPITLHDLSCRIGGAAPASVDNCFTINANDTILDNVWLWRADHGPPGQTYGFGWKINPARNGLAVNGNNVTAYGLFVEHFEGFQTIWNGNGGSVYFYQSECPYDVPDQGSWQQNGEKGFPSYKVLDRVTTHTAQGLGVYCFFNAAPVQLDNAIETPTADGIQMDHMVTIFLNGNTGSAINHVINDTGNAVTASNQKAQL